jgi:ecotropic viral integration site 5 protein
MPDVDMKVLEDILRTYAFYNPEVQYCQGMNYLTGFLFQYFRSEELAFKAMQSLIARQNIQHLFNPELPRIKLYFLQLDRLLGLVD